LRCPVSITPHDQPGEITASNHPSAAPYQEKKHARTG
jgi:hypothetical protein